jgi:hypothetical protein
MQPRSTDFLGAALLAIVLIGLVVILFVGNIPAATA